MIQVHALGDACPLPANWRRKHRQCCTERPMDVSSKKQRLGPASADPSRCSMPRLLCRSCSDVKALPSKRRTLLRYEKTGHVGLLQFQQLSLFVNSTGVTRQTAVRADNPMAGNDDGNFVVPHRAADRLRGHPGKPHLCGKLPRNFAVGCGFSVGIFPQDFPH